MALFIVIREGDANEDADDLVVVDDETLVRDFGRLLAKRLGLNIAAPRGVSTVVPLTAQKPGGGAP
jgi:hypothetical protein